MLEQIKREYVFYFRISDDRFNEIMNELLDNENITRE